MQGCINDQTHRMYLPTSLPLLLIGETLFDRSTDFESFADDYFLSAFGADRARVREYLEAISENLCTTNLRNSKKLGIEDATLTSGYELKASFINNRFTEQKFAKIPEILDGFMPTIKENMAIDNAAQRLSWTYLYYHSKICRQLARILLLASQNKLDEAKAALDKLEVELSVMESDIHNAFDLFLFIKFVREKLGIKMCKYFE
jgi:hypothetical protein